MTSRTYENIQGALSYVVLFSLAIAATFTMEYFNLLNAMDLSDWGKQYLVPFFITAWVVFAVALVAKLWGGWVQNKFWLKVDLANKLYGIANRVDPRRR